MILLIKNVILDIGNVLVTYYPDIYLSQFLDRKGEIEYFNHICFKGPEWKAGDLGKMSRKESIEAICEKFPADAASIPNSILPSQRMRIPENP